MKTFEMPDKPDDCSLSPVVIPEESTLAELIKNLYGIDDAML